MSPRLFLPLAAALLFASPALADKAQPTAAELFKKRILPIFNSPSPSSCVQCHLAGVDLKNYILPSHEKTFLSLRDQGLIDLARPDKSKILSLIRMNDPDNKGANLIHARTRQAELEAFAAWIKACCKDEKLTKAPKLKGADRAAPPRPVEVIRHARKDRLLASFESTVWAMRFRCAGCHMPGGAEHAKHVKKYGARVTWLKREGAEATMTALLNSRLIDKAKPERSLLLRKPLMEVEHGGGKKILKGDMGYKAYRQWLDDAAAILADRYARAADLPKSAGAPLLFGTDVWLKLDRTPPAWGDKLMIATVYAWDDKAKGWEKEPIAATDRQVWGKGRLWQHNLVLMAAKDSARAKAWQGDKAALPPGRYLVKVYVDADGQLAKDWKASLGAESFAGQVEVESKWPAGYGRMTVVNAERVRKPAARGR